MKHCCWLCQDWFPIEALWDAPLSTGIMLYFCGPCLEVEPYRAMERAEEIHGPGSGAGALFSKWNFLRGERHRLLNNLSFS